MTEVFYLDGEDLCGGGGTSVFAHSEGEVVDLVNHECVRLEFDLWREGETRGIIA